jgi:hypothetical protein
MVYLGGPRRRRGGAGAKGIYLHDPPPGYHPPRMPSKERQRRARQDWVLEHVATVVLILAAGAFMVMLLVFIATHS